MRSFTSAFINIFGIIILVILASSLLLSEVQEPLSFTSFMNFLSSQSFDFSFNNFIDYSIVGDWGLFNFLRDFFNLFIQGMNVIIYVVRLLIQLIVFVFHSFQFFFFR